MARKDNTIFSIFLQSIGLYFTNIDRFFRYMFFPVAGQLFGFLLTITIIYLYNEYNSLILSSFPALKNQLYMNIALGIVLLPILIIWIKALWDYMVAYSAVNSMTENMLKSERVYDFPAHTMMITSRWVQYIGLWILYAGIIYLSLIPIFLVFGWILLIYYAFVFQIFIFEPELSPAECFKRSSSYVHGNFKKTFFMIALVGSLTYIILPQIMLSFLTAVKCVKYLQEQLAQFISVPSLDWINMVLSAMGTSQITPQQVALFIVQVAIVAVFIQLLLPLRVISMCLWYKNFYNDAGAMKKIDDRILERAGAQKKNKRKK